MAHQTDTVQAGSPSRIVRVTSSLRSAAAARLVGTNRGGPDSAAQFLAAAEKHGISLDHFWVSLWGNGDRVGQACLIVPGSGRSAMTFTSEPRDGLEEADLAAVVTEATARLPGVHIAQALLEDHERGARSALMQAGYLGVGTLSYMRRVTPKRGEHFQAHASWPMQVCVRRYEAGDDPALIEGLERSYEQTLDCPELCGLRDTADVLDSHRSAGRFDPAHWWIVERDRKIEGMLLFNPCPEMGSIELVYLGLAPSLRGGGLGRRLLEHGLAHLIGSPEPHVTCAVDQRNVPALRLYRALKFDEFAQRRAFVKPIASCAPKYR
ncbi:MAG: GNAT family N-acetyltransferase [Phycisphaerae bacterium]|nr:GNAT family N-acetyltransferase [Phycisphaerae bacterium]